MLNVDQHANPRGVFLNRISFSVCGDPSTALGPPKADPPLAGVTVELTRHFERSAAESRNPGITHARIFAIFASFLA